jgi:hypothetical protein
LNTTICDAIRDGEIIEFNYEGAIRIVEPFIYGADENGVTLLKGYQIGGFNRVNDNSYTWDTYNVEQMSTIKFIGKKFKDKRAGYDPHDPVFKNIYCNY